MSAPARRALMGVAVLAAGLACAEQQTEPAAVTGSIMLQVKSDSLFLGRSMTAVVVSDTVLVSNPKVTWSTSDTNVVVVDSLGVVLGVGIGAAKVTAEHEGRRSQLSIRVVLQRADGGVTFTGGSANDSRMCALASGAVYCRRAPTAADSTPLFVRQPGAAGLNFSAVEGSLHALCGLDGDGRVLCWGLNGHFIFGRTGSVVTDTGPVAVSTDLRFTSFTHGGHSQSCGVSRTDSVVYCWGHNDAYQLMHGQLRVESPTIAPVSGNLRGKMVSTSNFSSCLIDLAGAAYCAGSLNVNRWALGIDDTYGPAEVGLPVSGGVRFTSISAGDSWECGISVDADAYCWGANSSGQLGNGTTLNTPTAGPQKVAGGLKFATLATVYRSSTCGITVGGDLYCWGQFAPAAIRARLGTRALQPYPLVSGIKFKAITRDFSRLCGITTDGRALCWD